MNSTVRTIGLPRPPGLSWVAAVGDAVTGLGELQRLYQGRPQDLSPADFIRYALTQLQLSYSLAAGALQDIPEHGPLLVVANHPNGAAEGLALLDLLSRRRPDARVLANGILRQVPEVAPLVIGVDVFRSGVNSAGVREALAHLKAGGALLMFPAGEVSRLDWAARQIVDPPWLATAAMLARRSGARILPIFVGGRPPLGSVAAGLIHTRLRTALLARDLLRLRGQQLSLRLAGTIEAKELQRLPAESQIAYLRLLTYSLQAPRGGRAEPLRYLEPLAPPVAPQALADAVAALSPQSLLLRQGELELYLAEVEPQSPLLLEIGRLRELSFRELEEGCGKARDLDGFDRHYQHLFVWHPVQRRILGAYRLGFSAAILREHGVAGLYTHTLFDFDARLFERLGPAIELGRSFVVPDWQRSFHPLRMLWAGIATVLARHPEVRCLLGPVSISPSYSPAGRQLIAEVLDLHHSDPELQALVRPRHPPRERPAQQQRNVVSALADPQLLSRVVARVERGQGLPVLLRHYLELNGRFAGFNIDDAFGGALDGLVFVSVDRIPPRVLARFTAAANS